MIRWIGGYLRHLPSLCIGMCLWEVWISLGGFKILPSNWGGQQKYGELGRPAMLRIFALFFGMEGLVAFVALDSPCCHCTWVSR